MTKLDPQPTELIYSIEQASEPMLCMGHSICWVTQIKESSFLYSLVFQCFVFFFHVSSLYYEFEFILAFAPFFADSRLFNILLHSSQINLKYHLSFIQT